MNNLNKEFGVIKDFLPKDQYAYLQKGLINEEAPFFVDKIKEIANTVNTMPKTYETDGQGEEAKAYLHYFGGSADVYITEKDINPGQHQAFGYSCLTGDMRDAEFGYISIPELTKAGLEMDFHFEPKSIKHIKTEALLEKFLDTPNADQPTQRPKMKP